MLYYYSRAPQLLVAAPQLRGAGWPEAGVPAWDRADCQSALWGAIPSPILISVPVSLCPGTEPLDWPPNAFGCVRRVGDVQSATVPVDIAVYRDLAPGTSTSSALPGNLVRASFCGRLETGKHEHLAM